MHSFPDLGMSEKFSKIQYLSLPRWLEVKIFAGPHNIVTVRVGYRRSSVWQEECTRRNSFFLISLFPKQWSVMVLRILPDKEADQQQRETSASQPLIILFLPFSKTGQTATCNSRCKRVHECTQLITLVRYNRGIHDVARQTKKLFARKNLSEVGNA